MEEGERSRQTGVDTEDLGDVGYGFQRFALPLVRLTPEATGQLPADQRRGAALAVLVDHLGQSCGGVGIKLVLAGLG